MAKEISYEVKLFLNKKAFPKNPTFAIEKEDSSPSSPTGKPADKRIKAKEDILALGKPIRLYIRDNGAADGGEDDDNKAKFYASRGLNRLVDVFVPFRLILEKYESGKKVSMSKNDSVMAVFEVVDPPEDTSIIKGPRPNLPNSRTGKDFIESLVKLTQSGKNKEDDNCIIDFVPPSFQKGCRKAGAKVKAESILCWKNGKIIEKFKPLPSDGNLGYAPINAKRQGALIYLNPPPILGDNYSFKITLTDDKWQNITLRKPAQTPIVTVWKRVKLQLIVLQQGLKYDTVKWNEVKNAYGDAFIDVVEPPNDKKHRVVLSKDDWILYLENHVYETWQWEKWLAYKKRKKNNKSVLRGDLDKFCFPQDPDLLPTDDRSQDADHNTIDLSIELAKQVFIANLSKQNAKNISKALIGANIGLCVLCLFPPNPHPSWGGMYLRSIGGKRFVIVKGSDVTRSFIHEMGHALFLKHGPTKFFQDLDDPLIVEYTGSGSQGPFWDQHDSEDMVSCVMSYAANFYDENGIKRVKAPTDWHLCGGCLLNLRFYDREQLADASKPNNSFLKLNYFKSKPRIAEAFEAILPDGKLLASWSFQNSITMKVTENKRLLAIYPQEGVMNNWEKDFMKDISHHPRGKWVYNPPSIATVMPKKVDSVWIAELTASTPTPAGKPVEIKFQIRYGPNATDVNESAPLRVTVTT